MAKKQSFLLSQAARGVIKFAGRNVWASVLVEFYAPRGGSLSVVKIERAAIREEKKWPRTEKCIDRYALLVVTVYYLLSFRLERGV